MKKQILFVGVIACLILISTLINKTAETPLIQDIIRSEQSKPGETMYRSVPPYTATIEKAAILVPYLTDMVITPDNKHILAASLSGDVYLLYIQTDGTLKKQERPFYSLYTSSIGYPQIEIGLTGIILGADFESSGDVFFLYSYDNGQAESFLKKKTLKARVFENRITRVHFNETISDIFGTQPEIIFTGRDLTSQAHQISRGVGVMIQDAPHILFGIGDSYDSSTALSLDDQAGKLLLMQRDGSIPRGTRPYPEQPYFQAIGIRNASSIAYDGKTVTITDTSNENFDRLLHGEIFDPMGTHAFPLSFKWNGDDTVLREPVVSPYTENEMVIHRWSPSETPTDTLTLTDTRGNTRILITTFGETKSIRNKPGKRILIGTLQSDGSIDDLHGLIERDPRGYGKLGNPISMVFNSTHSLLYFADFEEGVIYSTKIN